ncbi:DUF4129 domain-containing protein [Marinicrinis sediminis]|uniref:DUF4129 domain-containing protein n=1 Tax=Marinicrinis sediminis TaxID=1652465 RepID=A0ABW5R5Y8_9BACL
MKRFSLGLLLWRGVLEQLLFFPLLLGLFTFVNLHDQSPIALWKWVVLLTLCYAAGGIWISYMRKWRVYGVLAAGLSLAIAVSAMLNFSGMFAFTWYGIGTIAFARGAFFGEVRWIEQNLRNYMGLGFSFLGVMFYHFPEDTRPYWLTVTVLGLGFLAATLVLLNQEMMQREAKYGDAKTPIPKQMKVLNVIMVIGFMLLSMALFSMRWVQQSFGLIWDQVRRLFLGFMDWMHNMMKMEEPIDDAAGPNMELRPEDMLLIEESRPPFYEYFRYYLELVLEWVFVIVMIIGIPVYLWLMWKFVIPNLKSFVRWLGMQLQQTVGKQEKIYEDTVEYIQPEKDEKNRSRTSPLKSIQSVWRKLSRKEQIIQQYRKLTREYAKKGVRFFRHETPNEVGKRMLENNEEDQRRIVSTITAYNQVKYGERDDEG